jgi:2-haloacid dehalogenase
LIQPPIEKGVDMSTTLAFDVYGTLINTHGVIDKLETMLDSSVNASDFSQTWREKQLEYSFRRGLMRAYAPFSVCTKDALNYTAAYYSVSLSASEKSELLASYAVLPAFDDVAATLNSLSQKGFKLLAFSNGTEDAVVGLLKNAGIHDLFDGVVSVDDLQTFKPNPDVYHHFTQKAGSIPAQTWLVSSNPFDVIGAVSAGLKAAWVQRSKAAIFDPWGVEPTVTIDSLLKLEAALLMAPS